MKYLIIAQTPGTDSYGCMIDENPAALSDFRDRDGKLMEVVLITPVERAIAVPEALKACKLIVAAHPLNGCTECELCVASRAAEAAIKKAEGGAD